MSSSRELTKSKDDDDGNEQGNNDDNNNNDDDDNNKSKLNVDETMMPFYALGTDLALHVSGGRQGNISDLLTKEEVDIMLHGFCDQLRLGGGRKRTTSTSTTRVADADCDDDAHSQPSRRRDDENDDTNENFEQFTQYVLMKYGQQLNRILNERTQKIIQKVKDDGTAYIQEFINSKQNQKLKEDDGDASNNKNKLIQTDSGLVYYEIKTGTGVAPDPNGECTVEIHYHGTLTDGTIFESTLPVVDENEAGDKENDDSSSSNSNTNRYKSRSKTGSSNRKRSKTVILPLHGCIRGLQEGIKLMKEGGVATIIVPYELAYGDTKSSSGETIIPPGATLTYQVELYKVTKLQDFMKQHNIKVVM